MNGKYITQKFDEENPSSRHCSICYRPREKKCRECKNWNCDDCLVEGICYKCLSDERLINKYEN